MEAQKRQKSLRLMAIRRRQRLEATLPRTRRRWTFRTPPQSSPQPRRYQFLVAARSHQWHLSDYTDQDCDTLTMNYFFRNLQHRPPPKPPTREQRWKSPRTSRRARKRRRRRRKRTPRATESGKSLRTLKLMRFAFVSHISFLFVFACCTLLVKTYFDDCDHFR